MSRVVPLFGRGARGAARRVRLEQGTLVLPPARLRDLPAGCTVGWFLGLPAVKFDTGDGVLAAFLHDLHSDDLASVLNAQRRQAELQLGAGYARPAGEHV
jgi:hypothetical protein